MNIIIFGSTGFFGSALLNSLSNTNSFNIYQISRTSPSKQTKFNTYTYKDLEELKKLNIIFDIAIDFSSDVSVEHFFKDPAKAFLKNIEIPINNMKFLNELGFKGRLLYISTDRAFLDIKDYKDISELVIKNDPYGASKLVGEIILKYAARLNAASATILRFPNIYGPGQTSKQLIPSIINQIKSNSQNIKVGSFKGSRNYLFIDDAVSALIKIIESEDSKSIIFISGRNVKIRTIIESFQKIFIDNYNDQKVLFSEIYKDSPRANYQLPPEKIDDSYFRIKYNWEPKTEILEGLLITLNGDIYE